MFLSVTHIVIIAVCCVCGYFAAQWLFKKDTEVEERRRAAGRLASSLREMGFRELPEFFIDYSVGDYSGMCYKLKQLSEKMFAGEKAVMAELDTVFDKLLEIKLNTPEGRSQVKAKFDEATK